MPGFSSIPSPITQNINWINCLPSFKDKNVIKFGSGNIHNLSYLSQLNCKSLVCIGTPDHSDIFLNSIEFHSDLKQLESDHYDFVIIDETVFFTEVKSLHNLRNALVNIFRLLNDNGILLISPPPAGLTFLHYKFLLKYIVCAAGFNFTDVIICSPSFISPVNVYPFSQDDKFTYKLLRDKYCQESGSNYFSYKSGIKYILARLCPQISPFLSTILIAKKSQKIIRSHAEELIHGKLYGYEHPSTQRFYSAWTDKFDGYRQFGLIYYGGEQGKNLAAVCKQARNNNNKFNYIKQEYNNLLILAKHNDILKCEGIVVPEIICYETLADKTLFIESALPGNQLTKYQYLLMDDNADDGKWMMLDKLVDIQIFIQRLLSDGNKINLHELSTAFFENSPGIPYTTLNNHARLELYRNFAQHGDFTDINILYDPAGATWGILDWEWLAIGYPPFFDLFYLFLSLSFIEKRQNWRSLHDQYLHSFSNTFFSRNSYSDFLIKAMQKYCKTFNLDLYQSFDFLMDFLLFHYNKYISLDVTEQYPDLYKDLLLFSVENRKHFIVR